MTLPARPLIAAVALAAAASTAGHAAPVPAATASPLVVTTRVMVEQRRAAADGTTQIVLAKPGRVAPGDRVVILVGYRNVGNRPLGDVALADPLPRSIAFRGARAGSPDPEVSVDGRSFGPLPTLTVAAPGGARRPARTDDVTAVRWRLSSPLAPGGGGEFAFQGIVK